MSFPELTNKVTATIKKYSMLSGKEKILIGLSGGPDSVCLLNVLNNLKNKFMLDLYTVYIDHGLRPEETPEETEFCKKLCAGLSIPFTTKVIDVKTYSKEQGLNKQEAARELRYRIFEETAYEIKAHKIALGHTADDQLETFFMRFFRGSGPTGLSGIPPVRGNIIRPLIEIERMEIEEFLHEQKINYITDSSNLKKDYLRNRIRLAFIPEIKKINPHIAQTVSRTMEILREEEKYFELIITKTLMKLICRKTDFRMELFLTPLEAMDKVILRRVLRRAVDAAKGLRGMEFIHIEGIIDLIKQGRQGDRIYLPRGLRVIKNYSTLVITSEIPLRLGTFTLNVPGEVVLKESRAVIKASVVDKVESYGDGKTMAVFDADKTGTVLTVRSREHGDFFYPIGFGKRKKLQDYFVDEKVPRDERDSIPIVVSGNDIVWVTGFRGDERFKVSDETKRFLKMEIKRAL
ncbi:MAG: tRNA lysidine(34) synthetase TilS [Nitrospirae bacterium CG_4_10_14_0_8_um_filter_41_23]|nr:tRNA lysidine(34) synthetase TilS [Nitrospirota bacterium]OIP58939.1 MAG: tRNA lysidine(34) synthetase TilS [Nitrospirae bacterium CG2_30_41_42]PIQ94129.1 MAG: tRNA lysidine(34) synthetase TilS [Nitrospirae bacterium CG11_big_fil_rev_8_21_14_0_20_41_14]PIV43139.1 MAG: tRNA lysidine(34) synthetase TilS [Nitrospirae bacterium CG02_land_8_20_14_3_00_41_53]PIW87810.1 MAG: tRNA lysidine(34) synthetase TilS [Nitrospirae bacterium CG_4_8_14_3_um_filter_41_47]PIY87664.1 MAG: tRNA lysidine(34) synth